jgi:hypothetical protein
LKSYIAAGFDPARFWEITPRLYALEMDGAKERQKYDRAMAWYSAMLPHLKKPPSFEDFVGAKKMSAPRKNWEAELAAWRGYAARRR